MNKIIKEGYCSGLGICYIEQRGVYFYVVIRGQDHGPYTSFKDAVEYFSRFCPG